MQPTHIIFLFSIAFLIACGPSPDDLVNQLASPKERESARQELLLANERAIEPLLAALTDPGLEEARPHLIEVLLSLMMRVEDNRIRAQLEHHLLTDPNAAVRARIAHGLGLQQRSKAVETLVEALETDTELLVRYELLMALNSLDDKLDEAQRARTHAVALTLAADKHEGTRLEARIRLASTVDRLLTEARKTELKADLEGATNLYEQALAAYPNSKRANYRLGRHYYDNGHTTEGLERLRQQRMLLDVPPFASAPQIDGHLDDAVWNQAARADSFYQFSNQHNAANPSPLRTQLLVGYTKEALFIGYRGYDAHPDSIVVTERGHDEGIFWEDVVEIFIDANFDQEDYVHTGINTRGVVSDAYLPMGLGNRGITAEEQAWNADCEVAAQIGQDFWSIEYRLNFGQPQLSHPKQGTIWGFNFARTFRGREYSQWVRTFGPQAHNPAEFGLLLFH